jgi:hypothetical protein
MEYQFSRARFWLAGPNGTFSFKNFRGPVDHVVAFPLLPLTNIREFRLIQEWESESTTNPPVFHPPSFAALETLVIHCESSVSHLLSALFASPASSPSLIILAFLNCGLSDGFMEERVRFVLDRKDTTLAWLYHIVIVDSSGRFPSTYWMDEGRAPIVDARRGQKLPADTTQCQENVPKYTFSV